MATSQVPALCVRRPTQSAGQLLLCPLLLKCQPVDDNAKDNNDGNDDDDNDDDVDLPRAEQLVIDIVGIALGDHGCKCREHNVYCGKVVNVDIVVRLCHNEILVPDDFLGKGN